MVAIPVLCGVSEGGNGGGSVVQEWVVVELQGLLESRQNVMNGEYVGKLKVDQGKAEFHIGHHLLEGCVEKLKKPFAVLKQEQQTVEEQQRGGDDSSQERPCVRYRVIGVAKRRVVFRERPHPVVHLLD
eukprot:Nk52_evm1s677 gene=Nk52_evmTU1s677